MGDAGLVLRSIHAARGRSLPSRRPRCVVHPPAGRAGLTNRIYPPFGWWPLLRLKLGLNGAKGTYQVDYEATGTCSAFTARLGRNEDLETVAFIATQPLVDGSVRGSMPWRVKTEERYFIAPEAGGCEWSVVFDLP